MSLTKSKAGHIPLPVKKSYKWGVNKGTYRVSVVHDGDLVSPSLKLLGQVKTNEGVT